MARQVFFSFHYQRDVWRVNQIRNIPNVIGYAAAGFQDASLWEEAKRKGDAEIKKGPSGVHAQEMHNRSHVMGERYGVRVAKILSQGKRFRNAGKG
jgi:hypothetical protein